MQSRKKRNLEIEREKMRNRRISKSIGALVILVICAGIAWFAVGMYQRSWIMRFEGQRISTNELRFVMGLQDWWLSPEEVKDRAMNDLVEILTVMHHANRLGLGMTNEERDATLETLERGVISQTRMAEYFNVDNMMERLFEYFIPDLILDPEVYRYDIAAYLEERRPFYQQTEIMYILNDDFGVMLSVLESMENDPNADFGTFVMMYCNEHIDFEQEEPEMLSLAHLEHVVNPFEMLALIDMQPGETSDIIMFGDSFLLLHMHSRAETPDSEIQEIFLSNLARQARLEAFNEFFQQLVEHARFEINQRALDAL